MRCIACDVELNDYESTRKDLHGNYIDMCNYCYSIIKDDLLSTDREDLLVTEEVPSEVDFTQGSDD